MDCFHNILDYYKIFDPLLKSELNVREKAQFILDLCFENETYVKSDYSEAIREIRQAAEQGDAIAQYHLGLCYYEGIGMDNDYEEAAKWYQRAVTQNNVDSKEKFESYGRGLELAMNIKPH